MKLWQCPYCSYYVFYNDEQDFDRKCLKHVREVHPNMWKKIMGGWMV
jgi:hypothetical protein